MQESSYHLRNEPCPKCRQLGKDKKGDNLAVYSDGHCWCWSCGYYKPGNILTKLKHKPQKKEIPDIPEDITKTIKKEANDWLQKYFESVPNNFYYSESLQSLIVLIQDHTGHTLAWQKRYFGENKDYPKWVSYGIDENLIHIVTDYWKDSQTIVLVEDIISATKVGHILPTLCLFGSHISTNRVTKLLLLGYKQIILWLDPDKQNYMIDRKKQLDKLCNCSIILSDKDPKDYSYEKIKEYLYL